MDNETLKETQGHRKIKGLLEDLKRNKHFSAEISKAQSRILHSITEEHEKCGERFVDLININYKKWADEFKKENDNFESLIGRSVGNILADYGITNDIFNDLMMSELFKKESFEISDTVDFCAINDNEEHYLNEDLNPIPIQLDSRKKDYFEVYPVSIDIHRFASKRDVLDFIDKRWSIIKPYLSAEETKRFRKRKFNPKLLDFIWEKQALPSKNIIALLDTNFPKHGLIYFEIYKLISLEKKRRN